ncbi:AAA family ATPase [Argonema antarcticum]|uniref:AAA family ATPase n=1 Tax=Argonema antarcticum TaxID=2942763 RepID=UPI002010FB2C|nr:AAA family ATPase [Argonema antarcticum]MCL1469586.1 AAA family ATPase [Argonema antarcticum A004/B2]
MISIPGYIITEQIQAGFHTLIYRGVREQSQTSVIIKTLLADYPTLEQITRLRHEYQILQKLDIEGIVKAYALENYHNGLAIILEDFSGQSLKKILVTQKIELIPFLKISIQLAITLEQLHQNQIIHKDIKPDNILVNTSTGKVKIIDFSIASRLSRETTEISNTNLLEGTLAYISPEQTGRMNRSIDYRTDFYSLGITFYEILTGQLPFNATEPLELVHCHIAKQPIPLHQLNPEIPHAISDIVMKLLSKTAEDRYQSALGLKADLETCLNQLQSTGNISDFSIGKRDKSGSFSIPQKLYGRDEEVLTLLSAFDRVSQGKSEMMLVSGYSGIGKTSVVNEVHKPIVRQRGYFIAGKFDQFKRNIPYASMIQAFQELIRQLLTENSEKIAIWQEKLLEAVGINGQVIIDVIPEVELIIGPQIDVPALGPSESQNRFNRVFKQFIHVFTKPEHPLVVFLDDLQWADSASLKLIELLITDPDSQYLLMIGAYRDNEVTSTHPLMLTLEDIQKTGVRIATITLQPLDISNVRLLVADTLHDETSKSQPLAELVFNKTQGNPFFLTQMLQTLHQEELLTFNFSTACWQWNIKKIQAVGITDYNIVELIARNIQKLALETQQVLKLSACIGDKFNLEVLAIVNQKSSSETASNLWPALQLGLILPLSDAYKIPLVGMGNWLSTMENEQSYQLPITKISYKFLHDRVQQAAYSLIPEDQKKETHLKIGQLLLKNTPETEIEDNIFEIVNQLNIGAEFIIDQVEKDRLAQLNLIASRKAKAATAYEPALNYLTVGLRLLEQDSWHYQYDLTLNLYVEAVEVEYLNTNFDRAAILAEVVLQQATNLLDRVKVYETQIQFYTAQNQMLKAVNTGLQALELLGFSLLNTPSDSLEIFQLPKLEQLEEIPVMTNPEQLAAVQLLITVIGPAIIADPTIFVRVSLTLVNLCIQNGHSALAAIAYTNYGWLLCGAGKLDSGYHSGQVALRLLEQFKANSLKSKVYAHFNGFIRHWKEHIKESIKPLLEGIKSGLESGDMEYVGYNACHYCNHIFWIGEPLEFVEQQQLSYINLMMQLQQKFTIYYLQIWHQFTLNLQGLEVETNRLLGKSFNETAMLPLLHEAKDGMSLFVIHLSKMILSYLFKDGKIAIENGFLANEQTANVNGFVFVALHNFYYSLALLAEYPQVESSIQKEYLALVEENQNKMQLWALHAPINYQHKYDLVEAEKARISGEIGRAMEYYERAIQGAKEQGYIQEEALANELTAEFYLSRTRDKVAQVYLTDAYYGYIRWGAKAKVRDLQERYPEFFLRLLARETSENEVRPTANPTTSGSSAMLDLNTVIKASQAISSEIVFDKLLEKLMHILIENAGAQKGILLLAKEGKLLVAAEKSVDKDRVLLPSIYLETSQNIPVTIINYVERTLRNVVLNDATSEGMFGTDTYITNNQIKSLLCAPIIHQGKLVGILYLENNLTKSAFTPERLEILKILSAQAAISLELARAVNEVRDTVAYLRAIVNNIADGLLVTDINGKITHINPALLAMFHLEGGDAIAKDCQEIFNSQIAALVAETREHPNEVLTAEIELADGRIGKAVATTISKGTFLSESAKSECLGSVSVIRDITTEKEIDRMKTDFISTVSHELRTPLTSVLGFAKLIVKKLDDAIFPSIPESDRKAQKAFKQVNDNVNIIISEGERLTTLINDVLDIAKMEAGKVEWNMQPSSVAEIVDRAIAATSSLFQAKSIALLKDVPEGLPEVLGDRDRLLQVLINLISNSMKFTETGSCTVKARQEGNQIIFSVIDTGIGIAPADREKVFEKFQQVGDTLTDKPKGSGLGLPICKQIVEHHGGRIWVESQPTQGSNFSFSLPIADSNNAETDKISIDILVRQLKESLVQAAPSTSQHEKSILVVDDDANIRQLLRQQLEPEGYQVREAKDGMDAITQVKTARPDLIILDVMMPQMNGFDVAAVLKNDPQTMGIPIVILSIIEDKQREYRLGIDGYFTKPVNAEELLNNIGLLLSQRTSKKKILVVDEDASVVKTVSDVLQAKGYSVTEASNGQECIDKALTVKPDMIIVNSILSEQHDLVKLLRFEKGLENVFFVLLADGEKINL